MKKNVVNFTKNLIVAVMILLVVAVSTPTVKSILNSNPLTRTTVVCNRIP